MDDPEGHDAPVKDNEDPKVELENRGKEGKGDDPGRDGEEVPAELDDHGHVADGLLVIARVPEGLLVGGQGPSQGYQGGCRCETYKGKQEDRLSRFDTLERRQVGLGVWDRLASTTAKLFISLSFSWTVDGTPRICPPPAPTIWRRHGAGKNATHDGSGVWGLKMGRDVSFLYIQQK